MIPDLLRTSKTKRVYLGVGPEQNFTYIAALKPRMAFIVDIRRGNLQLHLMYKALFELSADRADFIFRLFSRKRPEGLDAKSTRRRDLRRRAQAAQDKTSRAEASTSRTSSDSGSPDEHAAPAADADDLEGIEYVYGPVLVGTVRACRTGRPAAAAAAATHPPTGT